MRLAATEPSHTPALCLHASPRALVSSDSRRRVQELSWQRVPLVIPAGGFFVIGFHGCLCKATCLVLIAWGVFVWFIIIILIIINEKCLNSLIIIYKRLSSHAWIAIFFELATLCDWLKILEHDLQCFCLIWNTVCRTGLRFAFLTIDDNL